MPIHDKRQTGDGLPATDPRRVMAPDSFRRNVRRVIRKFELLPDTASMEWRNRSIKFLEDLIKTSHRGVVTKNMVDSVAGLDDKVGRWF